MNSKFNHRELHQQNEENLKKHKHRYDRWEQQSLSKLLIVYEVLIVVLKIEILYRKWRLFRISKLLKEKNEEFSTFLRANGLPPEAMGYGDKKIIAILTNIHNRKLEHPSSPAVQNFEKEKSAIESPELTKSCLQLEEQFCKITAIYKQSHKETTQ
jgi:hypothetical protein